MRSRGEQVVLWPCCLSLSNGNYFIRKIKGPGGQDGRVLGVLRGLSVDPRSPVPQVESMDPVEPMEEKKERKRI